MWLSDTVVNHLREVSSEPDLTGTRYELVRRIGQGGMGAVYLARDTGLDRDVAIKVSVAPGAGDLSERLRREAKFIARLEHPGIVPVHDSGTLPDGRVFYVMKLVRGERLDAWSKGRELRERLRLFRRICEAVAFAHAHEVLHRDLKPENVMVGEFGEALVMDWGLARLLSAPPESTLNVTVTLGATLAGAVVGTPAYMAPEQARGDHSALSARTDVYGLGAILYALLEGRPPGPTPPPLDGALPPAVISICEKAMAAAPADRYPSATELGDDVGRFLEQEPVRAHPETLLERVGRFASRNSIVLSLVGVYLLVRLLLLLLPG
ncbi:MAG: serine/threonine-protein kinase [Archangium sp.]|nr:serine/threonine-protein kinase [Archangium sp.]